MIVKNAFGQPLKRRFTFVPEGCAYFDGYTVQITARITSIKIFFIFAAVIEVSFVCKEVIHRPKALAFLALPFIEEYQKRVALIYSDASLVLIFDFKLSDTIFPLPS